MAKGRMTIKYKVATEEKTVFRYVLNGMSKLNTMLNGWPVDLR